MAKVSLDIPDKVIEEHARTKIKELEATIKRRDSKISRLEMKVRDLEEEKGSEQRAIQAIESLVSDVSDIIDLSPYQYC